MTPDDWDTNSDRDPSEDDPPKATRYAHVRYDMLPVEMRESARAYIEDGLPPRGFLHAVLTNDFVGAATRADMVNRACLHDWAMWLWNEAPSRCWGSPAKVENWIEAREAGE